MLVKWLDCQEFKSKVIQDQIGLKQDMSLQQAVDAYVKKWRNAWQAEFAKNKPYELSMYTRIAYQAESDMCWCELGSWYHEIKKRKK